MVAQTSEDAALFRPVIAEHHHLEQDTSFRHATTEHYHSDHKTSLR